MERYIEVDKLAEHKFSNVTFDRYVSDGKPKSEEEIYAYKVGYNEAIDSIVRFAPTADVRENVHAHWTFRQLGGWHCSKCDEQAPFWCMASTQNLANFCPNCGAQMDERREDVSNC